MYYVCIDYAASLKLKWYYLIFNLLFDVKYDLISHNKTIQPHKMMHKIKNDTEQIGSQFFYH